MTAFAVRLADDRIASDWTDVDYQPDPADSEHYGDTWTVYVVGPHGEQRAVWNGQHLPYMEARDLYERLAKRLALVKR